MASHDELIKVTKSWIADFVIAQALCPFAQVPFDEDRIAYAVTSATKDRAVLEALWDCCSRMLAPAEEGRISNMFLLLPEVKMYLDLLALDDVCTTFMKESTLDAVFQTVCFHPDFRFAGESTDAAGHYVNRSPVPMLHILRVDEVAAATAHISDAKDIPLANKQKLEAIGSETLAAMLHKYIP